MAADELAVWMDGYSIPAGFLLKGQTGETAFFYDPDYVRAGGLPLSLALPLEEGEFGDVETRAFFANLLPENDQLQRLIDREGIDRADVVELLRHFGADCAGAVSCLPVGAPPLKVPGVLSEDYQALEDQALVHIVQSLAEARRLPAEVDDPSPVAGVQSKIAVTLLEGNRFALPRSGLHVPTTHILKVPERRRGREARREEAAALLARAASLDVSVPQAITVGDFDALLIERFDRKVQDGIVTRIHQEDFAQALGLPSDLKYQRKGRPGRWFDTKAILSVLARTSDPDDARLEFLRATLLNLCIGNTDNHAKNHALLYDRGQTPRLAPLYDLLPIRLDRQFNHLLAFDLGSASSFDQMTAEDLHTFLIAFGVMNIPAFGEQVIVPLIEALEGASTILRGSALKQFDDLIGREMERLAELVAAAVALHERDYFPAEGTAQ